MRHTLLQSLPVSSHKLTDFGTSRRNLINTREESARARDSAKVHDTVGVVLLWGAVSVQGNLVL